MSKSYVESFNGRFRDECLNENWFTDLDDAREKIEEWRQDYNQQRPHSSLQYRTPMEFALLSAESFYKTSVGPDCRLLTGFGRDRRHWLASSARGWDFRPPTSAEAAHSEGWHWLASSAMEWDSRLQVPTGLG